MNNRLSTLGTIAMLLLVSVLLWLVFVTIPGNKCEQAAQMMNLNYSFNPTAGCYVQQPSGDWLRIGQPTNYNNQP